MFADFYYSVKYAQRFVNENDKKTYLIFYKSLLNAGNFLDFNYLFAL